MSFFSSYFGVLAYTCELMTAYAFYIEVVPQFCDNPHKPMLSVYFSGDICIYLVAHPKKRIFIPSNYILSCAAFGFSFKRLGVSSKVGSFC